MQTEVEKTMILRKLAELIGRYYEPDADKLLDRLNEIKRKEQDDLVDELYEANGCHPRNGC